MSAERFASLTELDLERVVAHGGRGTILFRRVFDEGSFVGPWRFVDYAEIPPGASVGRHRHGENEELYLVLSGSGAMHVDGVERRVEAGSVILNRRGGIHGLVNDSAEVLRIFVVCVGDAPTEDAPFAVDLGEQP